MQRKTTILETDEDVFLCKKGRNKYFLNRHMTKEEIIRFFGIGTTKKLSGLEGKVYWFKDSDTGEIDVYEFYFKDEMLYKCIKLLSTL